MPTDALIALAAVLADHLWGTAIAAPSLYGRALMNRMSNPRPGDLVLVQHAPKAGAVQLLGKLRAVEQWRIDRDWEEKWDEEAEGRHCPTEPVYVLDLLDGSECRWWNVSLKAVPVATTAAYEVVSDPETLAMRPTTLEERIDSVFRRRAGDYSPLASALLPLGIAHWGGTAEMQQRKAALASRIPAERLAAPTDEPPSAFAVHAGSRRKET